MSTISYYDTAIDLNKKALKTLLVIMKRAQEHPDAASLPSIRLYEDMLPFSYQVRAVCYCSEMAVDRLAGQPGKPLPPKGRPDEDESEKTMDELIAHVEEALALLDTVTHEELDGAADRTTEVTGAVGTAYMTAKQYVLDYSIPNVMFHLNMAYAILRAKGVPLGKMDYLAEFVKEFFPAIVG
ncbi:hypothetical protein N656DRAFT_784178 [Canariomyces notabilis]|uniref:Uncharacterized protein n=1 Tax=Canariomyces notabilis TaxID=2074819 RepID=A0AAN6QDV3_9PEZI|nr:hypothetical protein N656DRAFT_784178 [Canariomyces arenarius]